jgi:hypothetical protein
LQHFLLVSLDRIFIKIIIISSLAATILAEITPNQVRGRFMAILTLALLYGSIFGAGMSVICLG